MSREIKFDIQITHTPNGNKWRDVITLDELLDRNGCLYNPAVQKIDFKRQFIGLKDRTGKEIFEGDIDKSGNVVMWSDKLSLFCQHFYLSYGDRWSEASYPMDALRTEIVGNIYENPELLPILLPNPTVSSNSI